MVSEPFPAMAPDTRSMDRLNELNKRLDAQTALAESNHAQLDQNTAAIADLKVSASRIKTSLEELAAAIASLTSHGQRDDNGGFSSSPHRIPHIQFGSYGAPARIASIGLLSKTEAKVLEAKAKATKSTSSAPGYPTPLTSTLDPIPATTQLFPLPAKRVSVAPGKTEQSPFNAFHISENKKRIWNYCFPSTMTTTTLNDTLSTQELTDEALDYDVNTQLRSAMAPPLLDATDASITATSRPTSEGLSFKSGINSTLSIRTVVEEAKEFLQRASDELDFPLAVISMSRIPFYKHWSTEFHATIPFVTSMVFVLATFLVEDISIRSVITVLSLDRHRNTPPLLDAGRWLPLALNEELLQLAVDILRACIVGLLHHLMSFMMLALSFLCDSVRAPSFGLGATEIIKATLCGFTFGLPVSKGTARLVCNSFSSSLWMMSVVLQALPLTSESLGYHHSSISAPPLEYSKAEVPMVMGPHVWPPGTYEVELIESFKGNSDGPIQIGYYACEVPKTPQPLHRVQEMSKRYKPLGGTSHCVGPVEVLKRADRVASKLKSPPTSQIHPVFHVAILERSPRSGAVVTSSLPLINSTDQIIRKPLALLDRKLIRPSTLPVIQVLIQWQHTNAKDATRGNLTVIHHHFPHFSTTAAAPTATERDHFISILVDKDTL